MAGRPRSMAKKLAEVEERVYAFYTDLEKLRPKQYAARQHEDEETQDELCLCWNVAVEEAKEAWWHLEELLQLLEERAGSRSLYLDRARARGLLKEGGKWWTLKRTQPNLPPSDCEIFVRACVVGFLRWPAKPTAGRRP